MLTGEAEYQGVKVTVNVPQGAFETVPELVILPVVPEEEQEPSLATMLLDAITGTEEPQVAEATLEEVSELLVEKDEVTEETPMVAFDITFYTMDEETGTRTEVPPMLPIDVEFSVAGSELDQEDTELQVYHVDSDVTDATAVDTEVEDETVAKVAAEEFSIYAIVATEPVQPNAYTVQINEALTLMNYYQGTEWTDLRAGDWSVKATVDENNQNPGTDGAWTIQTANPHNTNSIEILFQKPGTYEVTCRFLMDAAAEGEEHQYKTNTFIVSVEEGAYYADDVYVEVQFRDIAEKSAENPLQGVADSGLFRVNLSGDKEADLEGDPADQELYTLTQEWLYGWLDRYGVNVEGSGARLRGTDGHDYVFYGTSLDGEDVSLRVGQNESGEGKQTLIHENNGYPVSRENPIVLQVYYQSTADLSMDISLYDYDFYSNDPTGGINSNFNYEDQWTTNNRFSIGDNNAPYQTDSWGDPGRRQNSAGRYVSINSWSQADDDHVIQGMVSGLDSNGDPIFADGIQAPQLFNNVYQVGKGTQKNDKLPFQWTDIDTYHYGPNSGKGYEDGKFLPLGSGNFYFGMRLEATFQVPKNYDRPLTYSFSGDDDLWVFIDGKLVLDIGGKHAALQGEVDLETGKAVVHVGSGGREDVVNYYDVPNLRDDQEHRITILYLERGANESNCEMTIRLPNLTPLASDVIPVDQPWPVIDKTVSATVQDPDYQDANNEAAAVEVEAGAQFAYQIKVENLGGLPADKVVVTDVLPEGVTVDSTGSWYSATGGTASYDSQTRTITWNVPTLDAKQGSQAADSETLTVYAMAPSPARTTTYENTASISGTEKSDEAWIKVIPSTQDLTFYKEWVTSAAGSRSISITVTNGTDTYTGTDLTVGDYTLDGSSGAEVKASVTEDNGKWKVQVTGLPANGTYTVTETAVNGHVFVAGNQVDVDTNGDSVKDTRWVRSSATVQNGGTFTNTRWTLVNTVSSDDLTLNIHKTDSKSGANLSGAVFQVYKGTVAPGNAVGASATTDADGDATITLDAEDLETGTYVLYEVKTPGSAYTQHVSETFTITVSAQTGETVSNDQHTITTNTHYTATVDGSATKSFALTNTHSTGTLTIEKQIHIDDKSKIPDETVIFYGSSDNEKVTFAKDEFEWNEDGYYVASEQIFNLNTGSYTISETRTEVPGYDGQTGINGGTLSSNKTVTGSVQLGTSGAKVMVENHYSRTTHDLTVTKNVAWDTSKSQAPNAQDTYTVQVKIGTGGESTTPVSGLTVNNAGKKNATYVFTLKDNETATVQNVPYGVTYAVTEDTEKTVNNGGGTYSDHPTYTNATGTVGMDTVKVTVTNHYFLSKTTTFTVNKEWDGQEAESVTVQLKQGSSDYGSAVTLNESNSWSKTWENLPLHYQDSTGIHSYTYSVEETGVASAEKDADGRFMVYDKTHAATQTPTDAQWAVVGCWVATTQKNSENNYTITNKWYPASDVPEGSLTVKKQNGKTGTPIAGAGFTLTGEKYTNTQIIADADTGITFSSLKDGTYTLTETKAPEGYEPITAENQKDFTWTVEVSKDGLKYVKETPEGSNLFQNFWNWLTGSLTGGKNNASLSGTTLTVENTPIVTGLTKQVWTEQYTASSFDDGAYTDPNKWADSASWTGLAANTDSVKALFKVTVTGTAGASYAVSDTMTIDGQNVAQLVFVTARDTVPASGSVELYYVAEIPVDFGAAQTYTNTASMGQLSDSAEVTVSKVDYETGSMTLNKVWNHGTGDLANSEANKDKLDTVTFQLQRKTSGTDWANVPASELTGKVSTNATVNEDGTLTVATTNGADATVTISGLLMEDEDLNDYTYQVVETKIAGTAFTDGKVLGYTQDGPQTVTGGSATITNSYRPEEKPETGDTASFQVIKTDGADTKLQGAVFTLKKGNATVGTQTTGTNGTATFSGLTEGTYTLEETTPPAGYAKSNSTWTIVVESSNRYTHNADGSVTVTTNHFIAADGITGTRAPGLTANDYVIANTATDKSITVYNTRETGSLTITKALSGTGWTAADDVISASGASSKKYTFVVTAPAGSDLSNVTAVKADGTAQTVAVSDNTATVTIIGAGSVTLRGLPTSEGHGTYTVTEQGSSASIDGYTLKVYDAAQGGTEISANGGNYAQANLTVGTTDAASVTFHNDYARNTGADIVNPAALQVVKKDQNGNGLAGAGFTVYTDANCTIRKYDEQITSADNNYTASFTFSEADFATAYTAYYLKESTVPAGYDGDTTIWKITGSRSTTFEISQLDTENGNVFHKIYNWVLSLVNRDTNAAVTPGITETDNGLVLTLTVTNSKKTSPEEDVVPTGFQLRKVNESGELITHDSAVFTAYGTQADAQNETNPGQTYATENGVINFVFDQPDDVGTFYLKETQAPSGYAAGGQIWKVEVTSTTDDDWYNAAEDLYQKHTVYTVTVDDMTYTQADVLTVTNTRTYGYLTVEKTVEGLEKNETQTYTFTASSSDNGDAEHTHTFSITVSGNDTQAAAAIRVPTGTYTVVENNKADLDINHYSGPVVTGEGEVAVGTNHTDANPAKITITNTYKYDPQIPETGTVTGSKIWNDGNDADGLRPDSIRVQMLYNGQALDEQDVTSGEFTFEYDAYLYDDRSLFSVKEIGYTMDGVYTAFQSDDEGVPGYDRPAYEGFDITNTRAYETVTVNVEKTWRDSGEQPITLRLLANGQEVDSIVLDGEVDQTETESWKASFGELPKNASGEPIDYTVTEDALGGRWRSNIAEFVDGDTYLFYVSNWRSNGGGGDGDDGDETDIPDENTPTTDLPDEGTDIPDEETPTTDLPDEGTDIPDEETPLADVPATGDNLIAWILAAGVSGLGLVWLALSGKKRKNEEQE